MLLGPPADGFERLTKSPSKRGERVFHAGRNHGINPAGDQAVAFEVAQSLGQHLLRDASNPPPQFAVPQRAWTEAVDHQRGPLVGDQFQHLLGAALGLQDIGPLLRCCAWHRHFQVTISLQSAYFPEFPFSVVMV